MKTTETPYISISQYAVKYGVSRDRVRRAVTNKALKTTKESQNGRVITMVEDADYINNPLSHKSAIQELASSPVIKTVGEHGLIRFLQNHFGGSVHDCTWALDSSPKTSIPESLTVFMDTVFLAFPSEMLVSVKGQENTPLDSSLSMEDSVEDGSDTYKGVKVSLSPLSNKSAKEYVQAQGMSDVSHMPFDRHILTDIPYSTTILPTELQGANIYTTAAQVVEANLPAGSYLGYQVYRVSTCNTPVSKMFSILENIGKNQHGAGTFNGLPIFVFKVDITSNLPGAVVPMDTPYSIGNMEYKSNKQYVGQCCHTYVIYSDPFHTMGTLKVNQGESPYVVKASLDVDQLDDVEKAIIEGTQAVHPLYEAFYTAWQGTSKSYIPSSLETKVYDKARFQMEVGSVEKTLGNNLHHFLVSPQENISRAVQENLATGMGRVETRALGVACYMAPDLFQKAHLACCYLLSDLYLRETPVNDSIGSLVKTVKATTSVHIEKLDGKKNLVLCHWQNLLTGKIVGEDAFNVTEGKADDWIAFRTIRHLPHVHLKVTELREVPAATNMYVVPSVCHRKGEQKSSSRTRYYRVERAYISQPSSALAVANLCRIGENKASKSELIGKSFRGMGLSNMPFEPQKVNVAPRRFQEVEPSLGGICRVLCTPSMESAKSRSLNRYSNIPMECVEATVTGLNYSTAKKLPAKKNIVGVVLKNNGLYYLLEATGRLFTLAVQVQRLKNLLESYVGKRIQASRAYTAGRAVGYEFILIGE